MSNNRAPNSIRPPNSVPPAPPGPYHQDIPSFVQRQDRDTFGVKDAYNDSWGRAEAAKLDMVYESSMFYF